MKKKEAAGRSDFEARTRDVHEAPGEDLCREPRFLSLGTSPCRELKNNGPGEAMAGQSPPRRNTAVSWSRKRPDAPPIFAVNSLRVLTVHSRSECTTLFATPETILAAISPTAAGARRVAPRPP